MKRVCCRFWPALLMLAFLFAGCRQEPLPAESKLLDPETSGGQTLGVSSFAGALPEGAQARLGRGSLNVATFSPDDRHIAAAGEVGLYLYAADTLEEMWHIPTTSPIISLAFSPDGAWLASGAANGVVNLINTADGQVVQGTPPNDGSTNGVNALAWSDEQQDDEGQRLAVGFNDGRVAISRILSLGDGQPSGSPDLEELALLDPARSGITTLSFSPNGQVLATGDRIGQINLWDAGSFQWFGTMEGHEQDKTLLDLIWMESGDRLLSAALDGKVIVWDIVTFEPLQQWQNQADPLKLSVSADRQTFTVSGRDGQIITRQSDEPYQVDSTHNLNQELAGITISSDGEKVATFTPAGELALWSLADEPLFEPQVSLVGHTPAIATVTAQAWSPDGLMLATGFDDQVILWDTLSWQPVQTLTGHDSGITSLTWSPSGDELASAGRDDVAIIWDLDQGQPRLRLAEHSQNVSDLAFSPTGKHLVTAGSLDDTAIIWDLADGQLLQRIAGEGDGLWSVAWSPDGNDMAIGLNSGHIQLWDIADLLAPVLKSTLIRHSAWVSDLDYSPDGLSLASAGADGRMILTRLEDEKGKTYGGHLGPIAGVQFSSDGAHLATAGKDGMAIIWSAAPEATTAPLAVFEGHSGDVNDLSWSPDSYLMASASDDGTSIIWDILAAINE